MNDYHGIVSAETIYSPRRLYMHSAATSFPKPESVYQALDRFARADLGNPGRAGHKMALASERVRRALDGRTIARVVARPPRLVNLVTAPA